MADIKFIFGLIFTFFALFFVNVSIASAKESFHTTSIEINPQLNIEFNVASATGKDLIIILPSEHGIQSAETKLLSSLPSVGIEVWLSHLLESYFMENSASNLERVSAQDIQILLKKIHTLTNKNIILLSAGRGAIPILRALSSWKEKNLPTYIRGLILMHPKLFTVTPEPGLSAELMPSVSKTNQLIYLIQPKLSPFWWNRELVVQGLELSGSDVFVRPLSGIRNRFYFRPDATTKEQALGRQYAKLIYSAIKQIQTFPKKKRTLSSQYQAKSKVTSIKKERQLSIYKGEPAPPALNLLNLKNKPFNLQQQNGQVLLVNFWASWCPPCVHEMPSMQQLDDYFKTKKASKTDSNFKILAVNMAEKSSTIKTFLKTKVNVEFEILLDKDGKALQDWKIFAFPTSFILDKKGQIRYAIYGSIDWMSDDVKDKVQTLLNE